MSLTHALLRRRCPDAGPLLDRMERALERLRDLSRLLRTHESKIEWDAETDAFDAEARLRDSGDPKDDSHT